jgi:uncharacterized membrane protein YraQ (UPF0718 family)
MFTVILYSTAVACLIASFLADRQKTKKSLLISKKAFLNILPELSAIFIFIGIILTLLSPQLISRFVGGESGFWGMLVSSVLGAITLIPGFVAFPLAKSLLDAGAGIPQLVVFISTLMMVGIVTAPLEIRYFGQRQTILRNSMAFLYSFLVALIVGWLI